MGCLQSERERFNSRLTVVPLAGGTGRMELRTGRLWEEQLTNQDMDFVQVKDSQLEMSGSWS